MRCRTYGIPWHGGNQAQPSRTVRLIEHHGMRNARLRAAPEHVLVQPVEHEGRERLLQVVVLRRVDAYDRRLAAFPQAFVRFGQLKKTIVGQFIEPSEERTHAARRTAEPSERSSGA